MAKPKRKPLLGGAAELTENESDCPSVRGHWECRESALAPTAHFLWEGRHVHDGCKLHTKRVHNSVSGWEHLAHGSSTGVPAGHEELSRRVESQVSILRLHT